MEGLIEVGSAIVELLDTLLLALLVALLPLQPALLPGCRLAAAVFALLITNEDGATGGKEDDSRRSSTEDGQEMDRLWSAGSTLCGWRTWAPKAETSRGGRSRLRSRRRGGLWIAEDF